MSLPLPPSPPPPPSPGRPGRPGFTRKQLDTAVQAYDADPDSATEEYGPIADWDVSFVYDMSKLFYELKSFNADISNWHTSGLTTMESMFYVRSTRAPRRPCPARCLRQLHPTARQAPGPHLAPHCVPLLLAWQKASAFNQPLSWDTSSVTSMEVRATIRSSIA